MTVGRPPAMSCAQRSHAMRPRPSHWPIGGSGSVTVAQAGATHSPRAHTCPSAQARLQRPQWALLVEVSTQSGQVAPVGVHTVIPAGQPVTQAPMAQYCPGQQERPQPPQ